MRKTILMALIVLPVLPSFNMAAAKRSYAAGRFALTIDGQTTFLRSAKGLTSKSGGNRPITIEVGMEMGKGLHTWIKASFEKRHQAKTGVLHACNANYESMATRELINMHITEVTFPKMDASSKDPAYMTIKLAPETIHYKKGDGKVVSGKVRREA